MPTSSKSTRSSVASKSATKRQPLLAVTGNQSAKKSVLRKTPSKGMEENLDETTFDGSGLFGGTPGDGMLNFDNA